MIIIVIKEFLLVEPGFGKSRDKNHTDFLMQLIIGIAVFLILGLIYILLGILSLVNQTDDIELKFSDINVVLSPFLIISGIFLVYKNEEFFIHLKKIGFRVPSDPSKYKYLNIIIGVLFIIIGVVLLLTFNI
jgi:hypothetical protein